MATAVVAALLALVGILICRWTLGIPILAPRSDGAWGNAHTGEYVLIAALAALAATAVMHLLMLATPNPVMFFSWIVALVTLISVVYPFSTSAPLDQKAATAIVNLVLGIAIGTLIAGTAARASRRPPPGPPYPPGRDPYEQQPYHEPYARPHERDPYAPPPPRARPADERDREPTRPMRQPTWTPKENRWPGS